MKTGIADWLRTDAPPRNLYELLGHPLLDPDREAVLRSLRAANRELLDYQSHPEPAVANRAMGLLTELGWARGILEDPARWLAYTEELVGTVRKEFVADRGIDALVAGTGLADWLASRYGVDGSELYRVVQAVGWKPQSAAQPAVSPPAEPPKSTPSKFGVFSAPAAAPQPLPLSLDDTAGNTDGGRAARPTPGPREVYSLDDTDAPPVRPKSTPAQNAGRVTAAKRPPEQVSLPTRRSDRVPLLVAGAVILVAGLAAVAYLATREPHTRAAQATNEPEGLSSVRTEQKDGPPPTEPTPTAEPATPPLPTTEPMPTASPVRPAPKAETPIPTPTVSEPPPPPVADPYGGGGLAPLTPRKRNPFRGDPAGPQTREPEPVPEPVQLPGVSPAGPARPRPRASDKGGWVRIAGGEGTRRVTGVEARVESAGVKRLTLIDDSGARHESDPVLVIWAEVRNTGTAERRYRKWMNFSVRRAVTYDYCGLTADGKKVGKPAWLAPTTKVEEMPTWSDDLNSDRFIAPGGTTLVPLIFAVPPAGAKGLTLKLNAVRLTDYDGGLDLVRSDDKYGAFILPIPEGEWSK